MKINLLPQKRPFKANLHTHSTLSDGAFTPEELAKAYYEHGYQVLAITDHEFFVDHSDLNKEDFLLLTGYELQLVDESVHPRKKDQRCCHLCLISRDPHEFSHVYFNPESYDLLRLCAKHELIPGLKAVGLQPKIKEYSLDVIRQVIQTAVDHNMLVAFNHPVWSLEDDYASYAHLKGIYAMEIFNNGCYTSIGLEEYNPGVYDRILRSGVRTGCIATDDAHCEYPIGNPRCDLFGGWTMIMADDLSYGSIITALENGDFYASTGPEIYEISCEQGKVHVACSDAVRICLSTATRRGDTVLARPGEAVNEADFALYPEDQYIRITVNDAAGHFACSRAYFTEEIINKL